uniref:Major capsid protein n=1 Tax=Dulem virus 143 TaxID=3145620 RepID=A0AAU8B1R9_9VIRU
MSRNAESHFAVNPTRIDMSRSRFDRSSSYKTTFNVGQIIPFYVDEVLPGDTFSIDTSKVVRMQTLLTPVMDDIFLDTYYFFVPNRLTWNHWKQFMGENTESAWIPSVEYEIPQLTAPEGGWNIGTIADYMGIPTGVSGLSVNALPFRAYALIMNEWFRDENLSDPLNIPVTDATVQGVNTGTFVTDVAKGGLPYTAAKYHDYFTSALPAPQKGPDVTIPVAEAATAYVYPAATLNPNLQERFNTLKWSDSQGNPVTGAAQYDSYIGISSGGYTFDRNLSSSLGTGSVKQMMPANLVADFSGTSQVATIRQLRLAFQIQKLYERDARGGTRYIEILKSHFGVTSPDARLQRPEYLGGNRIPININQVVQSSSTDASGTPQGNTAAYSLTSDNHSDFTKSFVEHGFLIGVMVARYRHTYQQGLERFWSRKDRFDYYFPVFANIGEQAIKNREIYAQGTEKDDEVFGYQEAWADYRYRPNRVTGEMRSSAPQSLDVWHLGDDYESLPSLSDSWIREDSKTVNRVLAVSDNVSAQLFCDIYVRNLCTRPMPLYSIPGLIDHH